MQTFKPYKEIKDNRILYLAYLNNKLKEAKIESPFMVEYYEKQLKDWTKNTTKNK